MLDVNGSYSLGAPEFISSAIAKYLSLNPSNAGAEFDVLCVGVACLYAFVQSGWTGPVLDLEPEDVLPLPYRENVRIKCGSHSKLNDSFMRARFIGI